MDKTILLQKGRMSEIAILNAVKLQLEVKIISTIGRAKVFFPHFSYKETKSKWLPVMQPQKLKSYKHISLQAHDVSERCFFMDLG